MNFIQKIFIKKTLQEEPVADFYTTIIRVDDNYISASSVILDAALVGNIYSLKEVNIEPSAQINGNVTSRTAIIRGQVTGEISTTDFVDIRSTAVINGMVLAGSISIEAGAVINGAIRIQDEIDETELVEKIANRIPSAAFGSKELQSITSAGLGVSKEEGKLPVRADVR